MTSHLPASQPKLEIHASRASGDVLTLRLQFDEELSFDFSEELFRRIRIELEGGCTGLLVDMNDIVLLELPETVIGKAVHCSALKEVPAGVAIVSASRIFRHQLAGVLRRSPSIVPVRLFTDATTASDWLRFRAINDRLQ